MMMFETSKHVSKTEKRCVFKDNCFMCANKTILTYVKQVVRGHFTVVCLVTLS